MNNRVTKQLKPLIGGRVIAAYGFDDGDGDFYPTLEIEVGDNIYVIEAWKDDEGNGPGVIVGVQASEEN